MSCTSPIAYYSGIDAAALGSAGLKAAVHNLIDDHTVVSYGDAWEALSFLDASPSNASRVIGIYSDHTHDAVTERGIAGGWNREHSWPKSYGVGYSGPDFSDLHALFAADWNVNSARNNLYFDDCPVSEGCTSPAHSEASPSTAKDSERFQPATLLRGDLARAMFYMAVRYDGSDASTSDLELSETPNATQSTMGVLSTLLAWHASDPVSTAEMLRNQRICDGYQANRNPFVDHPEWAECIFVVGGACANAPPYPPTPPPLPPSPPPSPSPPSNACLLISGVIDGPRTGGLPKAAELFASCDVGDLSSYGLGKATNGGGPGGQTLTLPAGMVAAGTFIYISYDTEEFTAFFGMPPNATGSALNVNGDDAIELYHGGTLVDVFGDASVDGTGQVWEYTDGWAYRESGTLPSATWQPTRFRYSGVNALDSGCDTQSDAGCASTFPLGSYVAPSPPLPPTPPPPLSALVLSRCPEDNYPPAEPDASNWECRCCMPPGCSMLDSFPLMCVHRRCCTVPGSDLDLSYNSCCDTL
jgi:endonuclease I